MAAKTVKVRVNDGHAVNVGNKKKPALIRAGDTIDLPADKAEALAKSGAVEIVKTKEESESGS